MQVKDERLKWLLDTALDEIEIPENLRGDNIRVYLREALRELKERRESDLRPAAKFLSQDFRQLTGKVCSECYEVVQAWDDDFDQCPEQLPKEAYNDILMELVDVQMACETALTKIIPDRADRDEVRRQVIEKNAKRGYYDGSASNK